MYKHVLVAVDNSPLGHRIMQEAFTIRADHEDCLLTVLHIAQLDGHVEGGPNVVYPPTGMATTFGIPGTPGAVMPPPIPQQKVEEAGLEEQASLLDQIKQELETTDIRHQLIVKPGDPATEICQCADDEQVDLIVMGCHEKGALERLFLGSVSRKVIQDASVPVLVVK